MNDCGSDDLNAFSTGTVSTGELSVHLGDGTSKADVSVLLVHVNRVCARQVAENDTVVLDASGFFLEDLNIRYGSARTQDLPRW